MCVLLQGLTGILENQLNGFLGKIEALLSGKNGLCRKCVLAKRSGYLQGYRVPFREIAPKGSKREVGIEKRYLKGAKMATGIVKFWIVPSATIVSVNLVAQLGQVGLISWPPMMNRFTDHPLKTVAL